MGRTIEEISINDVEKRKNPSKHYVYVIYVTWSDGSTNIIYRRYSRFFDFQSKIMEMFPEEAGSIDPEKRIVPFLPGKKFFGRSHIREVAVKRLGPIAEYCKQIVKLPRKISQCKEVLEFFEMDMDDMNPQKGKKASIKGNKISTPKPLEVYVACTDYKKQEKGEVTLKVGMMVEVVEKTETGWWFVNADEEQGWVPSTCLEREDGEKEETTTRFKPGEEEQYLSTEEFKADGPDELSMERGAVVDVIEKNLEGWWLVRYNGKQGYVPATYLMKTEAFQVRKGSEQGRNSSEGPQIEKEMQPVSIDIDDEFDDDDTYAVPEEEDIYTISEISKILKENKPGDKETDKINENIRNMKSRSLKRGGSVRPPPRPDNKPMFGKKNAVNKPAIVRINSICVDYVTIAEFQDVVGDGISFTSGQQVKVLEKSEGGWWYIQIDDREGWAPASYIEKVNTAPPPSSVSATPPPPPQKQKPKATLGSQEDLTNDSDSNGSPRRISAVEGLKGALKAKLQKGKGPPTPPKKDFLDDDNDQTEKSVRNSTGPSVSTAASKPTQAKPAFQLPSKTAGQKTPSRNLLKSPPPPPQTAKTGTSETSLETGLAKPTPPFKVKPDLGNKPTPAAKVISKSEDQEESSGRINVAGLAGALKAKFENKEVDKSAPAPPAVNMKPKLEQKPSPPTQAQKQKPTPPNLTQKPKLETKPTPPTASQKPKHDEDSKQGLKPVLNKVGFPGTKPAVVQSSKPSWVKSDSDNSNKPPWAKQDSDIDTKPSWAKNENRTNTKSNIDNSSKPTWAKHDNDTSKKPVWAKPKTDTTTKPTLAKHEKEKPCVDVGGAKVGDLASVLKSKFENRQKDGDDSGPSTTSNVGKRPGLPSLPHTDNKPVTAVKPKPGRPTTPPGYSPKSGDFSAGGAKSSLDPKKYSSRPLPPKPPGGTNVEEETEESPARNKPLPGLPMKPGGGKIKTAERKEDSDSDDDARPRGVSGLANVLKARLGANKPENSNTSGNSPDKHSTKPLPGVPVKSKTVSTSNFTDIQNNNKVSSDSLINAIADFHAGSDGEMTLVIGQQYELLDKADGWWYVSSGSQEGWAPADYLEYAKDSNKSAGSKPVPAGGKQKRSVFRTCSDFTAENEGELSVPRGQEVNVLDSPEGGWWYVKYDGEEGWMPESYVEEIMV